MLIIVAIFEFQQTKERERERLKSNSRIVPFIRGKRAKGAEKTKIPSLSLRMREREVGKISSKSLNQTTCSLSQYTSLLFALCLPKRIQTPSASTARDMAHTAHGTMHITFSNTNAPSKLRTSPGFTQHNSSHLSHINLAYCHHEKDLARSMHIVSHVCSVYRNFKRPIWSREKRSDGRAISSASIM